MLRCIMMTGGGHGNEKIYFPFRRLLSPLLPPLFPRRHVSPPPPRPPASAPAPPIPTTPPSVGNGEDGDAISRMTSLWKGSRVGLSRREGNFHHQISINHGGALG
jgi:hypothetical protein